MQLKGFETPEESLITGNRAGDYHIHVFVIGGGSPFLPQKQPSTSPEQDIEIWRLWYEKVKAGEIPFSFEGQDVEYRFQPDGGVKATPLASAAAARPVRRPPAAARTPETMATAPTDQFQPRTANPWLWAAAAALAGAAWWRCRRVER